MRTSHIRKQRISCLYAVCSVCIFASVISANAKKKPNILCTLTLNRQSPLVAIGIMNCVCREKRRRSCDVLKTQMDEIFSGWMDQPNVELRQQRSLGFPFHIKSQTAISLFMTTSRSSRGSPGHELPLHLTKSIF